MGGTCWRTGGFVNFTAIWSRQLLGSLEQFVHLTLGAPMGPECRLLVQTSAGACVHAATRISNKIPNINAPKPRSIASLIKSGFSKSSRRTKPPPKDPEGGLAESALKREGAPLLPGLLQPGRHAPHPLWVAIPSHPDYRIAICAMGEWLNCPRGPPIGAMKTYA